MIYNTENKKSFKQSENNRCSEKERRILNIYMVTCLSWLRKFLSIFLGFINSVWWFRILVGGGSIKRMLWWETAWSGNSCGVFSLLIWISPPLPVSVKIFIMPPSVCLLQSKHKSIKDNIMLTPFPSWLDRVNEKRNYLRDNRLQLKFFFLPLFYRKVGSRSLKPMTIFNNGLCRWWQTIYYFIYTWCWNKNRLLLFPPFLVGARFFFLIMSARLRSLTSILCFYSLNYKWLAIHGS